MRESGLNCYAATMLSQIQTALDARASFLSELEQTDCVRLFHGVAEGVPGLAIDRYGSVLLLQTWRDPLTHADVEAIHRCVEDALGDSLIAVWNHRGSEKGNPREIFPVPELPARVIGTEHGLRFDVHPRHKTGDPLLFLDSRVARRRVREAASGKTVLNLFAYTCSAGVAAIAGGATAAWNVDFARKALDVGTGNARLNDIEVEGDAANPNYRSRLVAREINTHKRDDLFAATPPLEALKLILSMTATSNQGEMVMVNDISRAFSHAKAERCLCSARQRTSCRERKACAVVSDTPCMGRETQGQFGKIATQSAS